MNLNGDFSRWAAVHPSSQHHLLDHIAPLAASLGIPLIVAEEPELARRFYPAVDIRHDRRLEFNWGALAQAFEGFIGCFYWLASFRQTIRALCGRNVGLAFCPHGLSDKGLSSDHLLPYREQEIVFLYGRLHESLLKERGIPLQRREFVGNYRLAYGLRHQPFYDRLAQEAVFAKLPAGHRTLLYAPTWDDVESSSSFFSLTPALLAAIPSGWNLIIKPHPKLEEQSPGPYYSLKARAEKTPRVRWLEEFPPVYPILARSDAYLGDASSIGYDFLAFGRPIFFANDRAKRLAPCGVAIDPARPFASLQEQWEKARSLQKTQGAFYCDAFARMR